LTGTTMFWDTDTDPGKRRRNPAWIGIIPEIGRGTAFATVFAMCAIQILAKATATALLVVTDTAWLWYVRERSKRNDAAAHSLLLPPPPPRLPPLRYHPFFDAQFPRAGTTFSETVAYISRTSSPGAISCTLPRCPRPLPTLRRYYPALS
jgi:hypothetical protein